MTTTAKLVLAAIIAGIAVLAFAQAERFQVAQQMQSADIPLPVEKAEQARDPDELWLEQQLQQLAESLDAETGIAVQDIQSGAVMHHQGTDFFPQHSVTKLWVAMAALAQVDAGDLDLDSTRSIGPADLTLFYQPIRKRVLREGRVSLSIRELMESAIARSDNTANDTVLRAIGGPTAVEGFLAEAELPGIRFGMDERNKQSMIAGLKWRQDYAFEKRFYEARDAVPMYERTAAYESYLIDPVDGAQPAAIAQALTKLAKGELLSESSTRLLLQMLSDTRSGPNRLKGGLPQGWSIAHKTGTGQALVHEQTGYNDVGIVTAPDGRHYSIAVLIRRTEEKTPARQQMMQAVVRAVADYHARTATGAEGSGV